MAMKLKETEDLHPEDLPPPAFAQTDRPPFAVAEPPPPPPVAEPKRRIWNEDMSVADRSGRVVILTDDLNAEAGLRGLWYRNLGSARPWSKPREGWLCPESRRWIPFEPVGWGYPAAER